MALKRTKHLYEVLIRLGPDGFVAGHAVDLERVTDGGDTIAEKELPARNITEKEVGDLLGGEVARLMEQVEKLRAEVTAAEGRADTLERVALVSAEKNQPVPADLVAELRERGIIAAAE